MAEAATSSADPVQRLRGTLQLLTENQSELARFQIHKATTTLGRALTNDVRLLLEDVSRQHCKIEFNHENHAVLHVFGSSGVWHNNVHVKPSPTPIPLTQGDKLKISSHTLAFSYMSSEPRKNQPASPKKRASKAHLDSPKTPRRQSARLKARASMPCLSSTWTPERAMRPVPLIEQKISRVSTPSKANNNEEGTRPLAEDCKDGLSKTFNEVTEPAAPVVCNPSAEPTESLAVFTPSATTEEKEPSSSKDPVRVFEDRAEFNELEPIASDKSTKYFESTERIERTEPGETSESCRPAGLTQYNEPDPSDPALSQATFDENKPSPTQVPTSSNDALDAAFVEKLPAMPRKSDMIEDAMVWERTSPITIENEQFVGPAMDEEPMDITDPLENLADVSPVSQSSVDGQADLLQKEIDSSYDNHKEAKSRCPLPETSPDVSNSALTLCLEELEDGEATDGDRLLSALSPLTPHRVPSRFPVNSPATPLNWSPSKSRKVSLRTATLLKRGSQYPFVSAKDMMPHCSPASTPSTSAHFTTLTSTGSKDMEMSKLPITSDPTSTSSDEEDAEEVESSLELQSVSSPQKLKQQPLAQFMTPQVKRIDKTITRRMSCSEMGKLEPTLHHRSSWQWLRNLFSPKKAQVHETDLSNVSVSEDDANEPKENNNLQDFKQTSKPEHVEAMKVNDAEHVEAFEVKPQSVELEESDKRVAPIVPDPPLAKEEFFDASADLPEAFAQPTAPTPDMRELKHIFAEPKCVPTMETTMPNFRHMVSNHVRTREPASDVSLHWPTMEQMSEGSTMSSSPTSTYTENASAPNSELDAKCVAEMATMQTAMPFANSQDTPGQMNQCPRVTHQSRPDASASTLNHEATDLTKHRVTRTIAKKEPYVPVRRQLPPRNAAKASRNGSLTTTATKSTSATEPAATHLKPTRATAAAAKITGTHRATTLPVGGRRLSAARKPETSTSSLPVPRIPPVKSKDTRDTAANMHARGTAALTRARQ